MVAFALAALTALVMAGTAAAADKNKDGIPDKWEKKNHLSLKVNQAPKDQDHDGLNNAGEYADHTDPHNADTDGDGVSDSQDANNNDGTETESPDPPENGDGLPGGNDQAGTIASYVDGVLTIDLYSGGSISGNVTADTRYRCIVTTPATQESEPVPGDGPSTEPSDEPTDTTPEDEPGDDDPPVDPVPCGSADLVPGGVVHEANLEDGNFELLVLVK